MKKLKLIHKVIAGFVLILLISLVSYVYIYNELNDTLTISTNKTMEDSKSSAVYIVKSSLKSSINNYLRSVAERNLEFANQYYNKVKRGELSKEQALKQLFELFSYQKIGSSGYIYCINSEGVFAYHPKAQNIGKSAYHYDFIKKQIQIKNGVVEYKWKNPGENKERDKIAYSVYFEPWDLYIAPSSYKEEFNTLFSINDITEQLNTFKIGETGYIYILDEQGNMIYHPDKKMMGSNLIDLKDLDGNNIIESIVNKKQGKFIYKWKQNNKVVTKIADFDYIPELKWIVVAGAVEEEIFATLNFLNELMIIAGIVLVAIGIAILVLFGFNIRSIINKIINSANNIANAINDGKLDTRANPNDISMEFQPILEGINQILDNMIKPLNVTAEYVDRISKGDMPPKITDEYKGDFNEIKNNLNQCIDAISLLITDANLLANAADEGKLDVRADDSKHLGDYREIIKGFNKTLDNVVGPLNVAAEYVDRISKGDIPAKITDEYKGDFNEIKNNLNQLIDNINSLINDSIELAENAQIGKIRFRGDETKHQGDFLRIIKGVNLALDSIVGVMDNLPIPVMGIDNEFNILYMNKVGCSLGNVTSNDLENKKHCFDYFKTSQCNTKDCACNMAMTMEKQVTHETDAHPGNLDLEIQYTGFPIYDNEGNVVGAFEAVVDQTEIKKAISKAENMAKEQEIVLSEAGKTLEQLASGNLTARMIGNFGGENDKLKNNINLLAESLSELISQVRDAVQNTSSAAVEISSTADTMAAASAEQSAQADEVASAVEEMSRTITQNAMNATQTAQTAQKNGEIAKEGGDIVLQTVQKMKDIANVVSLTAENINKLGESSKEIGEIISVIDDIADQTNLLALNAAIEAARAGEQGRGFAVVADEVRKLAERTTEATQQIANMIKGIQSETDVAVKEMQKGSEEVTKGIELADRAGQSLEQVVSSSQELLDMINQIAAASEEQSATSEQIAKNVSSISQVTQETARQVQDIASASEGLAKLTEHLSELVSRFNVDDENQHISNLSISDNLRSQKLIE